MNDERPLVSVVIPTKNSAATIETCLKSIKKQTYPDIEVVVVDKFSTDETAEVAKDLGSMVIKSGVMRSKARNIGVEKARGELAFFVDSDMELTPRVVEKCVEKILNEKADAVIVPELSVGEGFWAGCMSLDKLMCIGDSLIEVARFLNRKAFEAVGGYDEELVAGEDWDLQTRIEKAGYKILRVNPVILHHVGDLSLKDILMKKTQYGKTIMTYVKKHPQKARKQLMVLRASYVRRWRVLMRNPLHALGLFVMRLIEYGVAWIGILSGESNACGRA